MKEKTIKQLQKELNIAKGTLGEFIYANYLEDKNKVFCVSLGKNGQDKGIDWRYFVGPHPVDIDVKLNIDYGHDYFSLYYHSGDALRMPFYPTCSATWLGIVTFKWEAFLEDLFPKANLEESIEATNQAIIKLQAERESKDFSYTNELLLKYVISIVDVKTNIVRHHCRDFSSKRSGDGNYCGDPKKPRFAAFKASRGSAIAACVLWYAIEDDDKIVQYQNDNISHQSSSSLADTVTWQYSKSDKILIDAKGKRLSEMNSDELSWIRRENGKSKASGFKTNFGLSQEDFDKLLKDLIDQKLSKIETRNI